MLFAVNHKFIIFDDGEEIEYLDTKNNKIGYEKIIK